MCESRSFKWLRAKVLPESQSHHLVPVELIPYVYQCAAGEGGRTMLEGEFTACTMVYKAMPDLIPQPYAWGRMEESLNEEWFFLSEYKDMDLSLPDASKFVARLVALHRSGTSENGMYGFPVPTCDGAVPHDVTWQKDWGTFYAQLLRGVASCDAKSNGHWTELDAVIEKIISEVIPRLLGPLKIQPSLIHGDMYEGNIGTDRESGRIMIFDASSYYAHNEMDLGLWRWNSTMTKFTETYCQMFKPSEPIEEFDDRNKLYSVKTKLNYSADHSSSDSQAMRRV